jgi:hypothetical protein
MIAEHAKRQRCCRCVTFVDSTFVDVLGRGRWNIQRRSLVRVLPLNAKPSMGKGCGQFSTSANG